MREHTEKKCANRCIECSVKQCEHHCKDEDYCALNKVKISTHEPDPTEPQCVDCASFKLANKGGGLF